MECHHGSIRRRRSLAPMYLVRGYRPLPEQIAERVRILTEPRKLVLDESLIAYPKL